MAIDRVNFYLQQLVTEADLDGAFDDVEDAFLNTVLDADLRQVASTDSPGPTEYGGILKGLEVSDIAGQAVGVTLGVARDSLGRRISIPAGATVLYTHAGATPQGDAVDAVGDGASIAASCPSGQRIIVSLFAVFDQYVHTDVVDGAGSALKYNYDQSFHFDLQIGAAAAHPTGQASLSSNKILLTDLLVTNNSGTLEIVKIANNNEDWDSLVGDDAGYANILGRRSDWLSFDNAAAFPRLAELNITRRFFNSRIAIRRLVSDLELSSNPSGAKRIGAEAQAGALTATAEAAVSLTAGGLYAQLTELLVGVNSKLGRGGGNVVPPAATGGVTFNPASMDEDQALITIEADVRGAVSRTMQMGGKRGHIVQAHMLFDDFFYAHDPNPAAGDFTLGAQCPWGTKAVGGAIGAAANGILIKDVPGGVVELFTNNAIGEGVALVSGYNSEVPTQGASWWNIGAAPGASFMFRFRIPNVADNEKGLFQMGLGQAGALAGCFATFRYDGAGGATAYHLYANCKGTTPSADIDLGAIAKNTWYTVRGAMKSTTEFYFQLNNGAEVTATVGSGVFADAGYALYCSLVADDNAVRTLQIDQAFAIDGGVASDMPLIPPPV